MQHAERRLPGADRPECAPDRDNLATILSMAMYVHDALTGASAERVAARQATLRDCIEASKRAGMLYPIVDPAIEDMISAVEVVVSERAENQQRAEEMFDVTIAAYLADAQSVRGLPDEPPAPALDAIMRVGGLARDSATAVWRSLAAVLASSVGGDR